MEIQLSQANRTASEAQKHLKVAQAHLKVTEVSDSERISRAAHRNGEGLRKGSWPTNMRAWGHQPPGFGGLKEEN